MMWPKKLTLKKTHDHSKSKKPTLTVILIHGIASDSSTTFYNTLKYLEGTTSLNSVRFVAFDLLGSGKSKKSNKLNYDYKDQLEALHNSILKLRLKTPLVLIGHSMGALIATKYADIHKKSIKHLILVSPPTYTPENLDNPIFQAEMKAFKKFVTKKYAKYINDRALDNEIAKIVLDKSNYKRLESLKTPATLIYSNSDRTIMPPNIKKVVQENPKYLTRITTIGTHRIARDKYNKIREILEGILNA